MYTNIYKSFYIYMHITLTYTTNIFQFHHVYKKIIYKRILYICMYVYNYTFGLKQTFKSLADTWMRTCGREESGVWVTLPRVFSHTNCALSTLAPHNRFSLLPLYPRINKNIRSVYHISRVSVLSVMFVRSCTTMRMWTRFLSTLEGPSTRRFLFPSHPPSRLDRPIFILPPFSSFNSTFRISRGSLLFLFLFLNCISLIRLNA